MKRPKTKSKRLQAVALAILAREYGYQKVCHELYDRHEKTHVTRTIYKITPNGI